MTGIELVGKDQLLLIHLILAVGDIIPCWQRLCSATGQDPLREIIKGFQVSGMSGVTGQCFFLRYS